MVARCLYLLSVVQLYAFSLAIVSHVFCDIYDFKLFDVKKYMTDLVEFTAPFLYHLLEYWRAQLSILHYKFILMLTCSNCISQQKQEREKWMSQFGIKLGMNQNFLASYEMTLSS